MTGHQARENLSEDHALADCREQATQAKDAVPDWLAARRGVPELDGCTTHDHARDQHHDGHVQIGQDHGVRGRKRAE
jgi:hypothetical protein